MRNSFRRMMAAVLVFSLSFQLLPLPALADGGKRPPLPAAGPAQYASHKTDVTPALAWTSSASAVTAVIAAPLDMAVVTKPTEVVGTAMAEGLTRYRLACAPVQKRNDSDPEYAPASYTVFAEGTQPVAGGVLGVFDPTLLPNGYYILRLTVEAGGTTTTQEITVSVEGELKAGSFSMSFVDMDLPIHGLPLSVIRTYDSREKDAIGRFGYGWDMKGYSRENSSRKHSPPNPVVQISLILDA